MRPDDSARGEKQSGQYEDPHRKAPRQMQGGKLPCRQVAPDRTAQRVQKKSRKTIFRPDEPRRDEKEKWNEIRPMEEKPETETGFAKENCQENKKCREINQSCESLAQARRCSAKPDS